MKRYGKICCQMMECGKEINEFLLKHKNFIMNDDEIYETIGNILILTLNDFSKILDTEEDVKYAIRTFKSGKELLIPIDDVRGVDESDEKIQIKILGDDNLQMLCTNLVAVLMRRINELQLFKKPSDFKALGEAFCKVVEYYVRKEATNKK